MASSSTAAAAANPRSDTFRKAVERFQSLRNDLSDDQKTHFATTGLEDIKLEIQQVQERYGPEKKLRNMRRLSEFLEAMSQIEKVVTVFLNVHDAVAFVWVRNHISFHSRVEASKRTLTLSGPDQVGSSCCLNSD